MYYGIYPGFMSRCSCPVSQNTLCDYLMTVNGKGKVTTVPDRASAILGVVTRVSLDEVPVCITEEAATCFPVAVKSSAAYEAATPIKSGLIDVTANVKAVFSYKAPQI